MRKNDHSFFRNKCRKLFYKGSIVLFIQLFTVLSIFGENLYGQQNKIVTVHLKDVTLLSALEYLTNVIGCEILYNHEQVKSTTKFDLNMKEKTIREVLDKCLENTNLTYKVVDDIFVLTTRSADEKKEKTVTGEVMDEAKQPLPGVTIRIKGTTIGVSSDPQGKFKLSVPDTTKLTLIFSFIGMETQEIVIKDSLHIKVIMKEMTEALKDVVVTGYANIKKSSFTGNAIRIGKEDLLKVSSRNVINVLQVFDPSFRIMRNNDMGSDPNTMPEFYIRGRSGIGVKQLDKSSISQTALKNNPNTPIFIMDGYETTVEKVYDFDPNRIESITILKDAAATAIYGSRAANGVVVIETKAPTPGKLRASYNFTGGLTVPDLSDYNLMNAREKLDAEIAADFYENDDDLQYQQLQQELIAKRNNVLKGVDSDWISQPLRNEFNHKHSLYIEGGVNDIRFGVDLRYDVQNGVMKGSGRKVVGTGILIDYRSKHLQIKNKVSYDVKKSTNSPYGSFSEYTTRLPYVPFVDENGDYLKTLPWHFGSNTKNPFYEAKILNNYDKGGYSDLTNNFQVNWYAFTGMQVQGQFSITKKDEWTKVFTDPLSDKFKSVYDSKALRGDLTKTKMESISWDLKVMANYVQSFAKHNINFSIGINAREERYDQTSTYYRGFPSGTLSSPSYAEETQEPTYADNHTRLFGGLMALNYSYDDIYLFDASFRLDGSSEFGSKKRTAPFYSCGVGLNIHNYPFLKGNPTLSLLKITGTFGQTGKVDFEPYAAKHTYEITKKYYGTGNALQLYYMGNDNLTWEITDNYDVRLELGFLQDAIEFKIGWYNKITKDLISDVTLPASTGFTSYKDNIGEVQNKGIELDIRANVLRNRDWNVIVFGNLAHNKNKIRKISESLKEYNDRVNAEFADYDSNWKDSKYSKPLMKYIEGGSLTSIWGMKSLGINPSDGKEIYVYRDGTIGYDWIASEQMILGDTEPDVTGAFGVNLQYKGFSLFATFTYDFGGYEYNQTLVDKVENVDLRYANADKRVLTQRWQNPGDRTKLKSIKEREYTTRPTSRFVQKNNRVDFKALTLSYDFNTDLINRMGLSMLRLQFQMNDVAHFSSVKQERGLSYPFARSFDFTLNVSF